MTTARHKPRTRRKKEHTLWSQGLLSCIEDAVIVTDREGRVAFMNPAAQTLTGWDEEALGKDLPEVFRTVNEMTRQTVDNPLHKVMQIPEGAVAAIANHSTLLISKNGTEVPIADGAAPLPNEAGHINGGFWSFATFPSAGK